MDVNAPTPLLGGLSAARFMQRHWQKKPLVVRQAWPGVQPPIDRSALFDLAGQQGVESRLLTCFDDRWRLRHGPFTRRTLPSTKKARWTLLVQGLDLHWQAAHEMLSHFRFVSDARMDDLMISYATDGGGVGPHLDSYDVFLLQVHGQRRWRIGPVANPELVDGLPVKILRHFEPTEEHVLEPGDLLYLPPLWGHDGIAQGECMTCSMGFRAASANELSRELLQRLADDLELPDVDGTTMLQAWPTGSAEVLSYREAREYAVHSGRDFFDVEHQVSLAEKFQQLHAEIRWDSEHEAADREQHRVAPAPFPYEDF